MTAGSAFTGCGTALVTPFRQNLSLDESAMRALVRRQIDAGIDFLVPCGTTGESPTLTHDEHLRVIEITVEEAAGRVPVLAGAGGYDTAKVISMISELEKLRVSGILSVTPYYNKPTQEGLFQHFKAIAESTALPIVLYSVQPRTNVNIDVATVVRLAAIPNIVGIKEASGSLSQVASILARVPDSFLVLSGDDAVTIPVVALGGHGVISVVANQIPAEFGEFTRSAIRGDYKAARRLQRKYQALMEVNFIESSPGPLKFAMARMGLLEPAWRLPLVLPQPASQTKIEAILEELGLVAGVRTAGARL
ncbi:MAG TPA: 4-hydroxy-tetrahydrodipicolinate synthase [Bryobacteraceae bacterium]|nr:4-hydroxy-tetrahydrodipicolinate synthase [Bryobacteraceae bacterium]